MLPTQKEISLMNADLSKDGVEVVQRLFKAGNKHDLPGFLACFASDYRSDPPNHPNRAFQGREQVKKNWSAMFTEVPDLRLDILNLTTSGNLVWVESNWSGTLKDQSLFHWRGVTIFTVEGGEITAARLYMEPVDKAGPDIDTTVKEMTGQG
jgi:ketosteroid isomerase-like protein